MPKNSKPNPFLNKGATKGIKLECNDFKYFLDIVSLEKEERNAIQKVLKQAKSLPAALGDYHGTYQGGLYDHTLLVTNLAHHLYEDSVIKNLDLNKIVLTSIYHDFGKVSYYGLKKKLPNRKVSVRPIDRTKANKKNISTFKLKGADNHVDECIAVLDKYKLPYDEEIHRAILFHHGCFSLYEPFVPNRLATMVYTADIIATRIHKI